MVDYSIYLVSLSTWFFFDRQVGRTILDHSYFLSFFLWNHSFMLWWCSHWIWWTTSCTKSRCPPKFFFDGQVRGTIVDHSYFPTFFVEPLLHALIMFLLKMVNYSMSFPSLSTSFFFGQTSRGDHSGPFLFSDLFCGTTPSCFDNVLAKDGELLHVLPLAVHLIFFLTDK